MKQLITETLLVTFSDKLNESIDNTNLSYISESVDGILKIKFPATILNVKNENGRIYSTAVMENSLQNAAKDIKLRKLLCTVNDHPQDVFVSPGEASHVISKAYIEKDILYTECDVLGTHNGHNLKALIDAKVSFGVSIRGLGSLDNMGNILDDYEFLGVDCVGNPSARLWTAPQIVSEQVEESRLQESNHKGTLDMKTIEEVQTYIKEQAILIKVEPDKINAFKRAALVESTISSVQLPGNQLAAIYNEWDKIKAEVFKEPITETVNKDLLEAQIKQYKTRSESLLNCLNTASKLMNIQIKKIAEAANNSNIKHQKTEKFIASSLRRVSTKLKKESTKLVATKLRVENLKKKYNESINLVAVETLKYNEAVTNAAAATKVAIKYAKESKTKKTEHSPEYDEAEIRIDELEKKDELTPKEQEELDKLYDIVEDEDDLGESVRIRKTEAEDTKYKDGDTCPECGGTLEQIEDPKGNNKLVCDKCKHTEPLEEDDEQDDTNNEVDQNPDSQPTTEKKNNKTESKIVQVISNKTKQEFNSSPSYTKTGNTSKTDKWITEGIKNNEHKIPGFI
jgi:DNA-directed RNA polymerase subunit M/transcription elongation factor TFIIS